MEQLFQELSTYPWSQETLAVWAEGDFRCAYCELDMLASLDNFKLGQTDHLLPTSRYPHLAHSPSNHVLSCWICNAIKRHWDANVRVGEAVYRDGDHLAGNVRRELIARAKAYVTSMRDHKTIELLATREAVERFRSRRRDVEVAG